MQAKRNPVGDDVVNGLIFIMGIILVFSPWYFRFSDQQALAWTSWCGGGFVVVVAALAVSQAWDWEAFATLAAGLWLVVSPWALGYADLSPATGTHVALGSVIAILSGVELWRLHRPGMPRAI